MSNKVINFSIDPSFSKSGVFILSDNNELCDANLSFCKRGKIRDKFAYFTTISTKEAPNTFINLYYRAEEIVRELESMIKVFKGNHIKFSMEYPPPTGSFASGLFMLDSVILSSLIKFSDEVYLVPPMNINSYVQNKSRTKTEIVERFYSNVEYSCLSKKHKLCHDEISAYYLDEMTDKFKEGKLRQTIYKYGVIYNK